MTAAQGLPVTPADRKRAETCKARAALAGFVVHEIEGDDGSPLFVLTRWAMTRAFDNLGELERAIDRIEGRRG